MNFLQRMYPGIDFEHGVALPELTNPHAEMEPARMTGDFEWEDDATRCLTDNRESRLIAPTGSGKTPVVQAALYHHAIYQKRRSLLVVPMQHLARSYKHIRIIRKNGDRYEYSMEALGTVFLGGSTYANGDVLNKFERWLLGGEKGSIGVTTSQTLVRVWCRLSPTDRTKALKHLFTAFDEAQHLSGVMAEDEDLDDEERADYKKTRTHLGAICEAMMEAKSAIAVISATHFRGDGVPTLLDKAVEDFKPYERTFQQHWKYLKLRAFNYNCIGYDSDPADTLVERIRAEPKEHVIACVPAMNNRFRKYSPEWVRNFLHRLEAAGLSTLDLVSPKTKDANKLRLLDDNDEYKKTGLSKYHVVLACNLLREATDWVPASRLYDTAPSSSAPRTIQTIGRLMRKDPHHHKIDISYTALFPNLEDVADAEKLRQHVSDRVNVAVAGMVVAENLFEPIRIHLGGHKQSRTFSEWMDQMLGPDCPGSPRRSMCETFFTKLDSKQRNGEPTEKDVDDCAIATMTGWSGDWMAGLELFRALAARLQKANPVTIRNHDKEPTVLLTVGGLLDPASIRREGFDEVRKDMEAGLFGANFRKLEFTRIDGIVRPQRSKIQSMEVRKLAVTLGSKKDPAAAAQIRRDRMKKNKTLAEMVTAPSGSEKGSFEFPSE